MLRKLPMVLIILLVSQVRSSAQQWDWARKIVPQNNNSRVEVLAVDELGDNYYLTGRFSGTVQYTNIVNNTCSTTSSSSATTDLFVARADNTGRIYWFVRGGQSDGDDQGNDIAALGSNRVVVTGYIGKGGSAATATFNNPPLPACSSAATTVSTNTYANGNKKAFIACYNPTSGAILWVSGLEDYTTSATIESEGRGISEDPTSTSRFFVTGYFKGDIEFGKYNTTAGVQSCTTQCSSPYYPYYENSEPVDACNTFVMQYYNTGCSNWFSRFYGDPSGNYDDNWNTGEDIVAYSDADENSLFVVGNFKGNLRQPTANPNLTVGGNLGYFDIMTTNDLQAGYMIKLEYGGGGWSGYQSTPCQYIYPIGGFVSWNGNAGAPVYSAQKLECQQAYGIVTMKSVTSRPPTSGIPNPVAVGEWLDFGGGTNAVLYANSQGLPSRSIQNAAAGAISDVFIAQYPGDLLSCNWVTSISGVNNEIVGGQTEFIVSPVSLRGADGACGVAYGSSGNIYLAGSFTEDCDVNSVSTLTKSLSSSSGNAGDIDMYIVSYDINGNNVLAEGMMGACNAPQDDYGSAVTAESNGYTGGYFAGYTNGNLGVNRNSPMHESVLSQGTTGSTMSYYGSHAPDECFSTVTLSGGTPVLGQYNVVRTPINAPTASVQYNLPIGSYNIAYRNPLASNPDNCENGLLPGWINVPLNVTTLGLSSVSIGPLSPMVIYEWSVQGRCGGGLGRYGVINPINNDMAKRGPTGLADAAQHNNIVGVYPNPVKSIATISFSEAPKEGFNAEVLDLNGRRVLSRDYSGNYTLQQDLDLSGLSNGLYCIKVSVTGTGIVYTAKMIKE